MSKINLCQLDFLSCFGCCGHSYTSREEIEEGILKNTFEYDDYINDKRLKDPYRSFMERSNSLRVSGICKNIIFLGKDKVGCPVHPKQISKKAYRSHKKYGGNKSPEKNNCEIVDLRKGHCDISYKCKTKKEFDTWNKTKQNKFLRFLKKKKKQGMDWYVYSIEMDNDKLLKEFLKSDL